MTFVPRAAKVALAPLALLFLPVSLLAQEAGSDSAMAVASPSGEEPTWAFEASDLPVDPDYRFGVLDNGLRYILRENATPEGTALVRMRIGSGSLEETDEERGLAHYLEHMAFNGSAGIPEGEMIKLLEREGLAFGADTNASTGFEAVTYMLNLPRNEEDLLDTALMLMRETASELTLAEDSIERERGIILAEKRDRANFRQRAFEDQIAFFAPSARFGERLPIGTQDVILAANAERLRALYERTYTPANTVLVIVGDFPVDLIEAKVIAAFADWSGPPAPTKPEAGPIDPARKGETDIYLDPALPEEVRIERLYPYVDEPDTARTRARKVLRSIGYGIVNRRLEKLARAEEAPFRSADFGTGDLFEDARTTALSIRSVEGGWRPAMLTAVRTVNEALAYGFTEAEIAEQVRRQRAALENAVNSAQTRSNAVFVGDALGLVANEIVPTTPQSALERFNALEPIITPEAVLDALQAQAGGIEDPLIRFTGRTAPEGGEAALRATFEEAMALPIAPPEEQASIEFAYSDFGEPGRVVADERTGEFGLRTITFANGVRLTLKSTDINKDRIAFRMSLDGGDLMNTREDPLRTYLAGSFTAGGLGEHSQDDLSTILAGRTVSLNFGSGTDAFVASGATTPEDLLLQLQLAAAFLTDPGYRPEAVARFRKGIDDFFETLTATPQRAYDSRSGAILSDDDPRFSLQPREAYFALDFAQLEAAIADRLTVGALEIALVGDLDEEAAILAVAQTFGALPQREANFRPREEGRQRSFTDERGQYVLRHQGEADQALIRFVWPTDDDSDPVKFAQMRLLTGVVRILLQEKLREELGQAYSPGAGSDMSHHYEDYGTFLVSVSVDAKQVEAARTAIVELIEGLRTAPIDEDSLERARRPLQEDYQNALKSLGGWLGLAARAQSEPERLERFLDYPDLLAATTPQDIQALARQYLASDDAVQFLVLPEAAQPPASPGADTGA
ncbi:MAG: insulinase family protein [Erythrobacter sp.]|jgi:zinc protease|nr:insulinase family protein [Erythrobacter sp.]